jgi:nicotinate-nucleotide adenylyltransferase
MASVLGILGGTFDPIHCGHVELARELRAALGLTAVKLVPAGDPPHRAAPVATAAHRLAMVELAVVDHPGLEVDARETLRRGRSYTVATLEELRSELPHSTLALIVGADAFLELPTWHRWRDILGLAHLIVVARPGVPLEDKMPAQLAKEWQLRFSPDARVLRERNAGAIVTQPITAHPISASAIRMQLARGGERIAAVRGLLPAAVLAYIDRNRLYRSRPDAT